jgi:hypothetical protein
MVDYDGDYLGAYCDIGDVLPEVGEDGAERVAICMVDSVSSFSSLDST